MKVIITGASGMVGRGVLLECLEHEVVTEVLSIGRSPLELSHPKLKQIQHKDFGDFSAINERLIGYDAVFLCMGVSAAGLNEEEYSKLTYNFTLALANILLAINPSMTLIYVSGEGTDSTEKGRSMWARVKGKTENALLAMGFRQAFMFRPGAIIPLRGIKSRTKAYQFMYDYFMWLVRLIKFLAPNLVVNTTQIGMAMINAATYGYEKKVLKPRDILNLSLSKAEHE